MLFFPEFTYEPWGKIGAGMVHTFKYVNETGLLQQLVTNSFVLQTK